MAARVLMTGNDAVGEGAVRAGCDCYFGYPITPQNELTAYMARHMPAHGRVFVQAESEVAAINMVFGAAVAGKRAMTSSSSPGISLKQEGMSYLAAAEIPSVIVNVQRGGPGLGDIRPSQADYYQATRGGGHGDYFTLVLAPDRVQEMHDLTVDAFELADRYRMPALILTDGRLGQMMEPVVLREAPPPPVPDKPWALTGARGREPRFVRSLFLAEGALEDHNRRLAEKYDTIRRDEVRYRESRVEDARILLVAYGTSARVAMGALREVRGREMPVGMLRPVTLWPFPSARLAELAPSLDHILVVEMSQGQMVDDVRLAVNGAVPVSFYGRTGGAVPDVSEVVDALERISHGAPLP